MNLFFAISEGLRDIASHKFRSFLTMMGVVFGVSSLMTMFAITSGMAVSLRYEISGYGDAEKIHVGRAAPPARQSEIADRSPGITYRDVLALRGASPLIEWVSPLVSHQAWVSYEGRGLRARVVGTEEGYLQADKLSIHTGRYLTPLDQEKRSRVAVLGSQFWKDFFPEGPESALGKKIKIQGVSFDVVGTFPEYLTADQERARAMGKTSVREARSKSRGRRGQSWDPFPYKNQVISIPITTMQTLFKSAVTTDAGVGPEMRLDYFQVGPFDPMQKSVVAEQIRNVLLVTHNGIEDVGIDTHEEKIEDVEKAVRAARLSGGIIAGIGLVVGGLGICNIMLASIVDRIRELGVRMALGAAPGDIFIQVLMEAFLLAVFGAVLGVGGGYGLVFLLDAVLQIPNKPIVEWEGVALSFAFAIGTGIVAGIYPSLKASRLKPVQALKFE
jgi:putative ABC transport system permease protein